MRARYDVSFTKDGSTYSVEAVNYGCNYRVDRTKVLYYTDTDGEIINIVVDSYKGRLKDEFRRRGDYCWGKSETLLGMDRGVSIRIPYKSCSDMRGWATIASRIGAETGLVWSITRSIDDTELILTRIK